MLKIVFLEAVDGTVIAKTETRQQKVIRNEQDAKILRDADLSKCYASSSMDFGTEYGFIYDDEPWDMIEQPVDLDECPIVFRDQEVV